MKMKFLGLLTLCLLFALGSAGCAKKEVQSQPEPQPAYQEQVDQDQAAQEEQQQAEQQLQEAELARQREFEASLIELGTMVHFDFDKSELKPSARDILQRKADILKQYPDVTMVIEGYCDDRGTQEYNLALGERRARASYEFLVLLGVAPERLSIVSYGEENPIDPAQNETAWALNRRDQFRISY
ncbi:MAG: peptidoglycan-associated lipoprotein [Desulfovibrionales bacterium]|jgi:peptidoglycan-associated lipoprotein|nr:peptidoglycan-associated lipoprotein [Desulfovibrionales bacterium]